MNLNEDHYYWWFLTQHNSEIGQNLEDINSNFEIIFLDVTKNLDVALFFACYINQEESKTLDHSYVYIFYDLELTKPKYRPRGNRSIDQKEIWENTPYTTYQQFIEDAQNQYDTNRLLTIDYSKLIQAYDLVKRLVAQSREIIIQIKKKRIPYLSALVIDGSAKESILKELDFILHINQKILSLNK
ncbi:MAG: hypothetical protein ACTSQP_22020 [Promethearchaeota archaeon]